ncbi:MAG: sigma-54 dependent transcriptional regulator [Planctomycetota bacterium]
MARMRLLVLRASPSSSGWTETFGDNGFELVSCSEPARLPEVLLSCRPAGVILVPPWKGASVDEVVGAVRIASPEVPILIADARAKPREVYELSRLGVEYHFEPAAPGSLIAAVQGWIDRSGSSARVVVRGVEAILGHTGVMRQLREQVLKIAVSPATTILLLGESGTGKELVARALHASSSRAREAFVAINCSAIPEALLESELFGHEPGAFTDAKSLKLGLFEMAHRGTVFLDEVAELGPTIQAKFLRFLEDRSMKRLGGTKDIEVDVRILSATNSDLERAVAEGRFRKDLYFRLQVVPVRLPPLRERTEDIPYLAEHFLHLFNLRFHKRFASFTRGGIRRMQTHDWPGNIRELKNAIERVVLLEDAGEVDEAMLSFLKPSSKVVTSRSEEPNRHLVRSLEAIELDALLRALEQSHGNQSLAARRLGISRDTVRHRVQKYGIELETKACVTRPLGDITQEGSAEGGA